MTLISSIISDAFRTGNLTAVGTSPTAAQETEALRFLNRIVESFVGYDLGTSLQTVPLGKAGVDTGEYVNFYEDTGYQFLPLNSRLHCNLSSATTIYLHPEPQDGSRFAVTDASNNLDTNNVTVDGNGSTIEDAATITLSTAGLNSEWFYREDLGNWVKLTDLLTTDQSPFPSKFDDMLITDLILRLAPIYGIATAQETMMANQKSRKKFRAKYSQIIQMRSEEGLLRTLGTRSTGYHRGLNGSTTTRFDKGWY
jgi:hypothetical protein